MTDSIRKRNNKRQVTAIVIAYPFVLLLIAVLLNIVVFEVRAITVAVPSREVVDALIVAGGLLLINHTWLMTTTELTRVRFNLFTTPEEKANAVAMEQDDSEEGLRELERRHNAHRNTTENVIYFVFIASALAFVSPPTVLAQVWIIGFPVARMGYTYSYLSRNTNARGLFMSLSLLSMYAIAAYLIVSLVFHS